MAGFGRILQRRRKELLFADGDPFSGSYVVLTGLVVVFRLADDGRMLILHVCRPGDPVAMAGIFGGDRETYRAHARATRDTELLFLPRDRFVPFLKRHPELAWDVARALVTRNEELAAQLENVTMREVEARVARYLLRELERAGVAGDARPSLMLPLAKSSLASYLGTVHETLSRTFSRLIRQGIVRVDGPRVTVLDPARLRRLI